MESLAEFSWLWTEIPGIATETRRACNQNKLLLSQHLHLVSRPQHLYASMVDAHYGQAFTVQGWICGHLEKQDMELLFGEKTRSLREKTGTPTGYSLTEYPQINPDKAVYDFFTTT